MIAEALGKPNRFYRARANEVMIGFITGVNNGEKYGEKYGEKFGEKTGLFSYLR